MSTYPGPSSPTWSSRSSYCGSTGRYFIYYNFLKTELLIFFHEIEICFSLLAHSGPENLKKVQAKKLVRSNKSIS